MICTRSLDWGRNATNVDGVGVRFLPGVPSAIVVAIVGLLMYALSSNAKVADIGKIMFWTGLLVTMFVSAGKTVKF